MVQKSHAYFWTAYRKLYTAERLNHGDSLASIAAALGTTRKAVELAIWRYELRDRKWLLGSEAHG